MKPITKSYTIKSPVEKVWEALVSPEIIAKWGAGPAKMNGDVGMRFSLWGGDVYGKNIQSEKNKKLVQEWYAGRWDEPSIVTFVLTDKKGKTKVDLTQATIPAEERKKLDSGWDDYYMGPLKKYLEGKK